MRFAQGLRRKLPPGKRRHEFQADHGFRKFFKTRAEQIMKPINVEMLMSHSTGISDSYYRPTEKDLFDDYLKAIDLLTINGDRVTLQKQITQLEEKSKDNEYIIKGKLQEKDKQIEALVKKQEQFEKVIQSLIDSGQFKPDNTL